MPGPHDELTYETGVVHDLTARSGWLERPHGDYDRNLRLLPADLEAFLDATQPRAVEQLGERLGEGWLRKTCEYVAKGLKRPGDTLQLLRGGKVVHGVRLEFASFRPTHGLNPETTARYAANVLTVVRQLPYSPEHGNTLDLAFFVNGLPVADAELKNGAGQTVAEAVTQYRNARDARDVFLSRRSVVHFAVDPDAVMMTTTLSGRETRFLPFNRGSAPDGQGGSGNYLPADGSHRTSYLWRDVFQRDAWLDLVQAFVHVEKANDGEPAAPPTLIFPRFHQWDCVLRFVADARRNGPGRNYLAMHSTGSGKTNTIGWLAHRLANLFDDQDVKVFDKVIVLTDRVVLDRQLQDKLEQFEQTSSIGMVRSITGGARELREALVSKSAKIIVVTIQTFLFVTGELADRAGDRFAVIVDEAHSSQSGESAASVQRALAPGVPDDQYLELAAEEQAAYDEAPDPATRVAEAFARARGRQPNISKFAFTATPKARTLQLFVRPDPTTGELRPTHLYSMRQAIEEEFILDVLRNYTTFQRFYRLASASGEALDEELVERSRALAAARRFGDLHPHSVAQKVAIMVEHYRDHVRHRIGGRAKAMVVTAGRLHAVRYKLALDRYLAEKHYGDLRALVAFSGEVLDPEFGDEPFTEPRMNGFAESQTGDRLKSDDYQVMIVAEKYLTGFSLPLLHTMYVDKTLSGITAVQTLSRLNRIHPDKTETFVLDFVNDAETIRLAYADYWTEASADATDPQVLYDTWERVEHVHVVDADDVEAFAQVWFDPDFDPRTREAGAAAAQHHAALFTALAPAEERFEALDEEGQEEFRQTLKQFNRAYGFLSQVISYADTELERRYAYTRILERRVARERGAALDISDELALSHWHVEQTFSGSLTPEAGGKLRPALGGEGLGSMTEDEQVTLAEVIERINDRYGMNLTEEHQLFIVSVGERISSTAESQEKAVGNSKEKYALVLQQMLESAFFANLDEHTDLVQRFVEAPEMQRALVPAVLDYAYRRSREKAETTA